MICLEPMWTVVQKEFLTDDMSRTHAKIFAQIVPDTWFASNNIKTFAQRVPDRWSVWNLCQEIYTSARAMHHQHAHRATAGLPRARGSARECCYGWTTNQNFVAICCLSFFARTSERVLPPSHHKGAHRSQGCFDLEQQSQLCRQ